MMVKNARAKIMSDFYIQIDKSVMTDLLDIVVIDNQEKKAVVIAVAIPSDRKKVHKNAIITNSRKMEIQKLWKF